MKKLLALVLALVMTLSLCITSNAAYSDAADVDYTEAVDVMSAVGVFQGADGKFSPKANLTREQGAKILTYMLLGPTAADALIAPKAPFSDVAADRWSAGSIAYCVSEGIIAGVGNNQFNPTGELTGYAFAKMCLVALGYRADMEGLTGADWSLNTATMIRKLDLASGITAFVGSKVLNRETAAQIALNTIQKEEVFYDTTSSVNSNGITTVGTKTRATGTGETLMEDVFTDLSVTRTVNSAGEATRLWKLDTTKIGEYGSYKPVVTYTTKMTSASNTATVAGNLSDYTYAAGLKATINGAAGATTINDAGDIAALTENGRVVSVFANSNKVIDHISILQFDLYKVSQKTSTSVTLQKKSNSTALDGTGEFGAAYLTVTASNGNKDFYTELSALSKGDFAVIAANQAGDIIKTSTFTKVEGAYTAHSDSNSTYTIGGTAYKANADKNLANLGGISTSTLYNVYLDAYGFLLFVEKQEDSAPKAYAYTLAAGDVSGTVSAGRELNANLLFENGTSKWVKVNKVTHTDGTTYTAKQTIDTSNAANYIPADEFFAYSVNSDGSYDLVNIKKDGGNGESTLDATQDSSVTKNSANIVLANGATTKKLTSDSVLVINRGSQYQVAKGISNFPDITGTHDANGTTELANVKIMYIGTVARMIVIANNTLIRPVAVGTHSGLVIGSTTTDYMFTLKRTATNLNEDGDNVYTWKVILNGEETQIDTEETLTQHAMYTGMTFGEDNADGFKTVLYTGNTFGKTNVYAEGNLLGYTTANDYTLSAWYDSGADVLGILGSNDTAKVWDGTTGAALNSNNGGNGQTFATADSFTVYQIAASDSAVTYPVIGAAKSAATTIATGDDAPATEQFFWATADEYGYITGLYFIK